MQRQSNPLSIRNLGESLDSLVNIIVSLLKVVYELVRSLFTHDTSNKYFPPSLGSGIATVKRCGEEYNAGSLEKNVLVDAAFLGSSVDSLGMSTAVRCPPIQYFDMHYMY